MNKTSDLDPYMSYGQLAIYMDVHPTTIPRYVKQGILKVDGVMPNGDKRVRKSQADRVLQQGLDENDGSSEVA